MDPTDRLGPAQKQLAPFIPPKTLGKVENQNNITIPKLDILNFDGITIGNVGGDSKNNTGRT